jgi:hypothetical protein
MLKKYTLPLIICFCLLIFSPSLKNFFSADDWFHLRLVQINHVREFLNFFSFSSTPQSASFYRPLSTQFFFWLFYQLFGLNSLPYFIFGLILFVLILLTLFHFLQDLKLNKNLSLLTVFLYGISASNFTRLYFISAFQELFLVLFILLALRFYLKKNNLYLLFFILALLSKETAIVFPGLVVLLNLYLKKHPKLSTYLPLFLISLIYLYNRFFIFQHTLGDSYLWDFSLKKVANTLMWYIFWSLGTPEFLVDYVGSGLKVLPKFFTDFTFWAKPILTLFLTTFLSLLVVCISTLKSFKRNFPVYFFSATFFLLTLLPVIFLPWHKFTLELGLPLIGFSLFIASLLIHSSRYLSLFFLFCYFVFNLTTIYLSGHRSYAATRAQISFKVYQFFSHYYPSLPDNTSFRFINDTNPEAKQWGSSKQISYATSGSEFFKVFYHHQDLKVYFDDFDVPPENSISISSKQFLE